ncbi:hypothetical protein SCLCIDRAFT_794724 [Scleroderma citrinum Foug A]|uniref:Uncharacterized protein n=1 Tax=Scleroderma citrinum Foug A TaxID=1036808 RepID=A0A0C3DPK0_9AGAM|nr:hypothetical protein SCLCIDRAFT_794724 [Scleroderma citrinum Foug A]
MVGTCIFFAHAACDDTNVQLPSSTFKRPRPRSTGPVPRRLLHLHGRDLCERFKAITTSYQWIAPYCWSKEELQPGTMPSFIREFSVPGGHGSMVDIDCSIPNASRSGWRSRISARNVVGPYRPCNAIVSQVTSSQAVITALHRYLPRISPCTAHVTLVMDPFNYVSYILLSSFTIHISKVSPFMMGSLKHSL